MSSARFLRVFSATLGASAYFQHRFLSTTKGPLLSEAKNESHLTQVRAMQSLGLVTANPTTQYNSLYADPLPIPVNMFRGSVEEYLQQYANLEGIEIVQITGEQVGQGVYDSSIQPKEELFAKFLKIIDEQKIKTLILTSCTLNANHGEMLGEALRENTSLERLHVTSNQLEEDGLIELLVGLQSNQSLKYLYCRSYNTSSNQYCWSPVELHFLAELISVNTTLEKIFLPDNVITEAEDVLKLAEAYKHKDKKFPEIVDLTLRGYALPVFNKEHVLAGEFDPWATMKFKNNDDM